MFDLGGTDARPDGVVGERLASSPMSKNLGKARESEWKKRTPDIR